MDHLKVKFIDLLNLELDQILKMESFKSISKSALVSCISNIDRDLPKETSIYHAIIACVKEDINIREKEFLELFQIIDLNELSA